jgi:hypothetical protein
MPMQQTLATLALVNAAQADVHGNGTEGQWEGLL